MSDRKYNFQAKNAGNTDENTKGYRENYKTYHKRDTSRYNDHGNRGQVVKSKNQAKQGVWENNQLKQAFVNSTAPKGQEGSGNGETVLTFNPDDIFVEGADEYEFVFDENVHVDYDDGTMDAVSEKDGEEEEEEEEENREAVTLPISKYKQELLQAVQDHQVLIIVGETGSGKTTQLPQYLMTELNYRVAVTQPRRVAATSVATRVAEEAGVVLGQEVGYSVRFDDKSNGLKTRLKYMTDGMLLREFVSSGELSEYDCIMIDEAHERTLATDILMGLIKERILHSGSESKTKIIISSATINSIKFSEYFNNAPIFQIPGKTFPVNVHYTLQPEANYIQACITTVFQIHLSQTKECVGDVLVFLTGQDEIELVQKSVLEICDKLEISNLLVTPIYANLSNEQQLEIFQKTPVNHRKVVLATNIAETSLTIDGIRYVVDPGFVKVKHYNALTGMSELVVEQCSKASVNQRAGRAGRTAAGDCFRIFPKEVYFNEMEELPEPEIKRTSLSSVVLLLISLGVKNLLKFDLLDKPSVKAIAAALDNLYLLGALNSKGEITKLGKIMNSMPCEPNFVKVMMIASFRFGCLDEALKVVSMLHETQSLFDDVGNSKSSLEILNNFELNQKPKFNSDHMLYYYIYSIWEKNNFSKKWCRENKLQFKTLQRVKRIYLQFKNLCERQGLFALNSSAKPNSTTISLENKIAKSFIAGFPNNIVRLGKNGSYKLTSTTFGSGSSSSAPPVYLHPSCLIMKRQYAQKTMNKPYKILLYQQLLRTSKEFVKDCIPVYEEEWLHEMCPQLY